jgi:hypothetical protein
MKKKTPNDGNCIYTSFRKINDCVCDNTCEYSINCDDCHNCALEFANQGEHTLEEIAKVMDYTTTGIMIIQNNGLEKLKKKLPKGFKFHMYD